MAVELPLIKFLAVVTVFDFVILIDGVKRDNLALMEFSIGKTFSDNCISKEHRRGLWPGEGAPGVQCIWVVGGVATL